MKMKIVLIRLVFLLLFFLSPAVAGAEQPIAAKEIAGSYDSIGFVTHRESSSPGFFVSGGVPSFTLVLNSDGNGTAAYNPSERLSVPMEASYQGGMISASTTYVTPSSEYVYYISFSGVPKRDGDEIVINGEITLRVEKDSGYAYGEFEWKARKKGTAVGEEEEEEEGEEEEAEEDIPVLTGPEQGGELPPDLDSIPGIEPLPGSGGDTLDYDSFPHLVPDGEGNWNWDWGYGCDCEDELWERHAGPLATAIISVIAAVAAALGGSLGSAGGAAAGAVAEALGVAGPEAGVPDGPDSAYEKEEPAEERETEPADDYLPPPEAGYGGPDDNPYTSFLGGKGPGDCVQYGLPRYWVNTATLNLVIQDTFFENQGLGPEINLTLSYNSALEKSGIFGRGWNFSYEWLLEQKGDQIWVYKGSGQGLPFSTAAGATPEQPVETRPPAGIFHRLLDYGEYWLYIQKGSAVYMRFDRVPGMNLGRLTQISDYYGNAVCLSYSPRGNLETITDAAGRSMAFAFNEQDFCSGFALPDGRQASFDYDGQGKLVHTEDLMGIAVNYEYDAGSTLTKMVTGKSKRTVAFTYQQKGKERLLRSFSDPNGNVTRYVLLAGSPRRVEVTDPEGNKTIFQSRGGLTEQVIDPLGRAATVEYRDGLPVSCRDRNGGLIRWEYDGAGQQIKEIDQLGEELLFAYDPFGNLTGITDPLGGKWVYRYNDRHSLVGITSPAGRTIAIDYNEQGLPVSLTGFDGLGTAMEYDRFGNVVRATSPAGGVTTFSFDEQGYLPTTVTDALGHSATFEHDGNGRLISHRHPNGSKKSLVFDCCYSLLATDERGLSRGYERDANGNILKEIDASLATSELAYDGNNNLISLLNNCRKPTRYRYDGAGRLNRVTNALGQNQLFNYDPAGNLLSFQLDGGGKTAYEYDPCHRKIGVIDPLGAATALKRDPLGRVIEERDARGKKVEFAYDPDGLLERVFHDGQEAARYIYDSGGRLIEILDPSGKLFYTYDEAGGFKAITYPGGSVLSTTSNGAGLIESITYPGGPVVKYLYDSRLRPVEMSWPGGWVKYSYDPAGNLVEEERSNGTSSSYEYDKNERLIRLKHLLKGEPFIERRYRRDASGSILEEEGNQPLSPPPDQDFSLSCNPADQMAGPAPFRYDGAGNLVEAPGWRATYDGESRLEKLSREGLEKRFYYNGLGHLIQVDSGEESFSYGRDPQGNLMFESRVGGKPVRFYLYCHSRPVALVDEEQGTFYYHYDQSGNTLALTDSDGRVAASYTYSPFGYLVSSGDTAGNPFTFCGALGVMDQGEGLYFMKKRFYSARWGRFVQKDPLGFEGGTNPYLYAANNPLFYIDPDGALLMEAWITWKTVGLAVGVATSVYYTYKVAKSSSKTVSETKKSAQAMEKMNKAYDYYSKICDHYGEFGGWDAKEAAWRRYVHACHEFNKHKNAACQGVLDTADNLTELGKNAVTPDALSLPVAIYEHASKGGGSPLDPCRGGKPVTATKGVIWQLRRHY